MKNRLLLSSGIVILLLLVTAAILAPVMAPHNPTQQNLEKDLLSFSQEHLLGTDKLGRDILSRILYGARISLLVGISTVTISLVIGLLVGIASPIVVEMYFQQIPFFLFMVAAGIYFNRTREVVHQEKLRVAGSIGGTIAHELRTPLLSIRTRSEGIAHLLPALVSGYRTATRANTPSQIPEKKLQLLEEAFDDIDRDVDYANTVIDMLLISSRTDLSSNFLSERVSALEVAKQSIEQYPYANSKERDMVVLGPCEDFMIFGPSVLIMHVLFNLVKNALYYVQRAGEGTVEIGVDGSANTIYVLDSGPGIPPENRKKIFDRFYSTTDGAYGSGIGLSFCRQAVEDLGGKIVCDSELGSYSRFSIEFPSVENQHERERKWK